MALTFDKAEVLVAVDQLRGLVAEPDTDDDSYIRKQVRDAVREVFDLIGDREALRALKLKGGELTREELVVLVEKIRSILWPDRAEPEEGSDDATERDLRDFDAVVDVMSEAGLGEKAAR